MLLSWSTSRLVSILSDVKIAIYRFKVKLRDRIFKVNPKMRCTRLVTIHHEDSRGRVAGEDHPQQYLPTREDLETDRRHYRRRPIPRTAAPSPS